MSATVTGVDFVVVAVTDFDRSVEFYGETLGLERSIKYGDHPGMEFEAGNLTLAVLQMDAFGREWQGPGTGAIALQVDDVEAAKAQLEAKGVEFSPQTIDSGVCHQAFFSDPDGNALILHHRYRPREG